MNRRLLYFIIGLVVVVVFIIFIFIIFKEDTSPKVSVRPSSTETLRDTDKDGTADWLEILNETDPFDPKDFPYRNNLDAIAEEVGSNELPTEFVIETVSRLRNDILGIEKVSPRERDRFLNDSYDFFSKQVDEYKVPEPLLQINENVDKELLYLRIINALLLIDVDKPLEEILIKSWLEEPEALASLQSFIKQCEQALSEFPTEVPSSIVEEYQHILGRIQSLCQGAELVRKQRDSLSFLYLIKLFSSYGIYQDEVKTPEALINSIQNNLSK